LQKANEGKSEDGKLRPHHQQFLRYWWRQSYDRPEMISVIKSLPRYIACSGVTKRPIFNFISSAIQPDHSLFVFAFPDDYSFGILQSSIHWLWFITKCSKLKSDYRYTPPTVFDTFPWPQSPNSAQVISVAEAGRDIRRIRNDVLFKIRGGLRTIYRTLELPGTNPLKDAHANLDMAVFAAYGFSSKKALRFLVWVTLYKSCTPGYDRAARWAVEIWKSLRGLRDSHNSTAPATITPLTQKPRREPSCETRICFNWRSGCCRPGW